MFKQKLTKWFSFWGQKLTYNFKNCKYVSVLFLEPETGKRFRFWAHKLTFIFSFWPQNQVKLVKFLEPETDKMCQFPGPETKFYGRMELYLKLTPYIFPLLSPVKQLWFCKARSTFILYSIFTLRSCISFFTTIQFF